MRIFLFLASVILATLFPAGTRAACDRLRIQELRVSTEREVTTRLSCITADAAATPPSAGEYTLLVDEVQVGQGRQAVTIKVPIDLVVIVQGSATLCEAMEDLKEPLRSIADALAKTADSEAALVTYSSEVKVVRRLGPSASFRQAVDSLAANCEASETRLLESFKEAYALLKSSDSGRLKVVLIVSDGIDQDMTPREATKNFKAEAARLRAAGIVVMSVGYSPFGSEHLRYLSDLVRTTGGSARTAVDANNIGSECLAALGEVQRKKQQQVTFALPQSVQATEALFQVVYEGASGPRYSNSLKSKLPAMPPAPKPRGGEDPVVPQPPSPSPWLLGGLLAGLVVSCSLLLFTFFRRSRPVSASPRAPLAPHQQNDPKEDNGRTVSLSKRLVVGWIVKLNPTGAHETILVGEKRLLGVAPFRCQIYRLHDGFELLHVDSGSPSRRIEDGQSFELGGDRYKFKAVVVER